MLWTGVILVFLREDVKKDFREDKSVNLAIM